MQLHKLLLEIWSSFCYSFGS